jgi:hypothetical protein
MQIRAMIQKMPGFLYFTGYQSAQFMGLGLVTEQDYN